MSLARKFAAALAVFAGLLGVGLSFSLDSHAQSKRGKGTSAAKGAGAAGSIVSLTNRERTQRGLPALKVDGRGVQAISGHVADMAKSGFLSHQGSDGRGPDARYKRLKPGSLGAGENLAYNTTGTGASFVQQWMNSSDHRSNILNPKYKGIGVALRANCSSGKEAKCTYYAGQCFSL